MSEAQKLLKWNGKQKAFSNQPPAMLAALQSWNDSIEAINNDFLHWHCNTLLAMKLLSFMARMGEGMPRKGQHSRLFTSQIATMQKVLVKKSFHSRAKQERLPAFAVVNIIHLIRLGLDGSLISTRKIFTAAPGPARGPAWLRNELVQMTFTLNVINLSDKLCD